MVAFFTRFERTGPHTSTGIYAGRRVVLFTRTQPRVVDVLVLEGNLVGSELEGLRELLQACEPRPVRIQQVR